MPLLGSRMCANCCFIDLMAYLWYGWGSTSTRPPDTTVTTSFLKVFWASWIWCPKRSSSILSTRQSPQGTPICLSRRRDLSSSTCLSTPSLQLSSLLLLVSCCLCFSTWWCLRKRRNLSKWCGWMAWALLTIGSLTFSTIFWSAYWRMLCSICLGISSLICLFFIFAMYLLLY